MKVGDVAIFRYKNNKEEWEKITVCVDKIESDYVTVYPIDGNDDFDIILACPECLEVIEK